MTGKMMESHGTAVAHAIAVASASIVGTSLLADLDHIVSIIAGITATIAGIVSVYIHVSRRIQEKKEGKKDE